MLRIRGWAHCLISAHLCVIVQAPLACLELDQTLIDVNAHGTPALPGV
jgi:hypothetical protein